LYVSVYADFAIAIYYGPEHLYKNLAAGCWKWCVAFCSGERFIPQCTQDSMCTSHSIAGLKNFASVCIPNLALCRSLLLAGFSSRCADVGTILGLDYR
jgi:hypothetical protein